MGMLNHLCLHCEVIRLNGWNVQYVKMLGSKQYLQWLVKKENVFICYKNKVDKKN